MNVDKIERFRVPGQLLHDGPRGARVTCERTGRAFESALADKVYAVNAHLAVKMMRQADPRLAELPAELRTRAEDFLTLHKAWGTSFEASGESSLFIDWNDGENEARGYLSPRGWLLRYQADDGEVFSRQTKALVRSHDFAEFVQRFKSEVAR